MTKWNYADAWETVAEVFPDHPAIIQGDRSISFDEFDQRANGVARRLVSNGARHQDKVAIYLYNCPEYLETMFGAFKASLVPVNTNYRYVDDELVYLWDNADAVAVVFHGTFTERIEGLRHRVPAVTTWLWVDDSTGPCPEWATPYEDAASEGTDGPPALDWQRSGDDLFLLYTGGTTGMPKGVMWPQHDHFMAIPAANSAKLAAAEPGPEGLKAVVKRPGLVNMPGAPLMHGTGLYTQMASLALGGTVVLTEQRSFDAEEFLDLIDRHGVGVVAIVGDAFSRPLLACLDAEPDRWDLSSLLAVLSSGVMWSQPFKDRLLAHCPGMSLIDVFSSSEAIGMGSSTSAVADTEATAKFSLGPNAVVIADDGSLVEPGSGVRGRVAVAGWNPLGYYKDQAKTDATFLTIDGRRYSCPGDYAIVEADGTITLLGRGSVCINTGGEKVFPEEVEEVLKLHESVADAVVVGVPDDRFGSAVVAVVEAAPGSTPDEATLVAHVRERLAGYKAPKQVLVTDTIGRAPNAKVDYARHTAWATEQLGPA